MCFVNITAQIFSPLALIITSILLGRLFIKFWSMAVRIYTHSAIRALVRSGVDVESWGAIGIQDHPKGSALEFRTTCTTNHVFMNFTYRCIFIVEQILVP